MGITFKMSISVSKKRQWITRSGITGKLWVSMQDTWFVCDAAIHTVRPPKLSRWRADREKAWKTSSKHLHHMLRERRAIDSLNRVPELRCLIKLFLQNSVYYLCIVYIIFGSTIWKPNRNVANGRKSRRGGLKKKREVKQTDREMPDLTVATASPWISKRGHNMVNNGPCLFPEDCHLWQWKPQAQSVA